MKPTRPCSHELRKGCAVADTRRSPCAIDLDVSCTFAVQVGVAQRSRRHGGCKAILRAATAQPSKKGQLLIGLGGLGQYGLALAIGSTALEYAPLEQINGVYERLKHGQVAGRAVIVP